MAQKNTLWLIVLILAATVLVGCKEKPQPAPAESAKTAKQQNPSSTKPQEPTTDPKPTLSSIIAQRRGWGPAYLKWRGKQAPDFTLTDINGKQHTLSEYRGRNVMLIFWATWCRPCIMEIPHLIELRKSIGEDKLAMLAISYIGPMNSADTIKRFVANNPVIDYTVFSTYASALPKPYNFINGIPCSFFIGPDGKIKLATEGLIPLSQIKAIIEAER